MKHFEEVKKTIADNDSVLHDKTIVAFDFDGTLVPWCFPRLVDPFAWVKPTFKAIHEKGHQIWIYSARFNADFYGIKPAQAQYAAVWKWMRQHDLRQYAYLTRFKPPADIIFDDWGQRLRGDEEEDVARMKEVLEI